MKLLITSVDAVFDKKTKDYFPQIKDALDTFESLDKGNKVVIISIDKDKLSAIPQDFYTLHVARWLRKSPELIRIISEQTKLNYEDIMVLGAKDGDMQLAANAKLLLLTAHYAIDNNPEERIYLGRYGIGVMSGERLKLFFEHFLKVDEPWYYSLDIDADTKLYGLTNAMTRKMSDRDVIEISDQFREFLKDGKGEYQSQFLIYATICLYRIFQEVEGVKYWGYYPSSGTHRNEQLFSLKEILRKFFNSSKTQEDILIRHSPSQKRHQMSAAKRMEDACNSQFDTLYVNPWFKKNIKGQNICIIDDFTNIGTSCETARHLLKAAGANKIIFIALGKFRDEYQKYDYQIQGNVFEAKGYTYKHVGTKTLRGAINNESSNELFDSLKHILS